MRVQISLETTNFSLFSTLYEIDMNVLGPPKQLLGAGVKFSVSYPSKRKGTVKLFVQRR